MLFPIIQDGELVAAPGLRARAGPPPGAGRRQRAPARLRRAGRALAGRPPGEPSGALRARSGGAGRAHAARPLGHRSLRAPVQVDRAAGAPYAAAYVDGILRINPAFLYLAARGDGPASLKTGAPVESCAPPILSRGACRRNTSALHAAAHHDPPPDPSPRARRALPGQGPRHVPQGRPAHARHHRPALGVRPRPHHHPLQGRDAQPAGRLLVRADEARGPRTTCWTCRTRT